MSRTAVYRFYGADDRLLYVGVTADLPTRWRWHEKSADWWPHQRRIGVVWHESRADAEAEETRAVRSEEPVHNVAKRGETPRVTFRADGELWNEFGAATVDDEDGRSGILRQFMRWYLGKPGAELPQPKAGKADES